MAIAAAGSASTHHRSAANGRISSAQPIGDSHVSQPRLWLPPESPTARRKKTTPSTAIDRPRAPLAVPLTCAATAATAAKTRPQPTSPSPNARAPVSGRPLTVRTATASASTTALAADAMATATASEACRPTAVDPMSSSRPVSSSARVCRTTRKMLIRPAASAA